jgi:hypothetical protein
MPITEPGQKVRHCRNCKRELYSWTETTASGMKIPCGEGLRDNICGDCGLESMVTELGGFCIEQTPNKP